MKRLTRWTLDALTVLSVLLCLATAALWVRPQSGYGLERGDTDAYLRLGAFGGRVGVVVERGFDESVRGWHSVPPSEFKGRFSEELSGDLITTHIRPQPEWSAAGAGFARWDIAGRVIVHAGAPLWTPLVAFAFLPIVRALYAARRRRNLPGRCQRCRYDLTGNFSGVCPECGTAVTCGGNMRRIGRLLINAVTALSLLLCVVAVVVWVRSYWRQDGAEYRLAKDTRWSGRALRGVMANQLSLSWEQDGRGGRTANPEWPDVERLLERLRKASGTVTIRANGHDDTELPSLQLRADHGRYLITLGEIVGDDYEVRTPLNGEAAPRRVAILGDLWDARIVISDFEVVVSTFSQFFTTGNVSPDVLT